MLSPADEESEHSIYHMTRLDWDKANRRQAHAESRPAPKPNKKRALLRENALVDFAARHHLKCLSCGAERAEWAKSGISKRGPWIVCVPCVRKRQADQPPAPIAEA